MRHIIKLNTNEKIKAWLDLCDFYFDLIKENLSLKNFKKKLNEMREDKIKANKLMLKGLSRIR